MSSQAYTTAHLDYLQRTRLDLLPLETGLSSTSNGQGASRLCHVQGVGRLDRQAKARRDPEQGQRSTDVLMAAYGEKIPLAFCISGTPSGITIHLGTWSQDWEALPKRALDSRQEILKAALTGMFADIALADVDLDFVRFPLSGLVLGVPTSKPPDRVDGALSIDRLIRAMAGTYWSSLLLADPVQEGASGDLRNSLIYEMRSVEVAGEVEAGMKASQTPPLAKHYLHLLNASLMSMASGIEVGLWRVGVYLLGERESYYRLASVWRGIFSGEKSLPESVRVWDTPAAAELGYRWLLPDIPGDEGPGSFRHPLKYQTLLTSEQLAAYIHLPQVETSGFTLRTVPEFDVVPPPISGDDTVTLGTIIDRTRSTEARYRIPLKDLTRHTFVAGVTGAGKTNTVFNLLRQAWAHKVPFLVLEPAKNEYRALMEDEILRGALQVFTLADELISPFRLNPFEVVSWPKVPVGVHLDLLRSAFTASFGMWAPLPQILEQCLHAVYADRGWEITTNSNHRLSGEGESDIADAFPTLAELSAKAGEIIAKLGYDAEITDRMRAALLTRLNGLRVGGKGTMLDAQRSLPIKDLLARPTVLELQNMGDDDDKAFLMALLLIRLYEHRRGESESADLRHILVVEEAHRLLANSGPRSDQEQGDPHAKAVETFSTLLAEIRAYGQGVIVADQVPVKLAPDIIKNTNLKIAHRIVASDDRAVIAGAMAMEDKQARALATLTLGQAAVFSAGDDAPVLVQVPVAKNDKPPADAHVRDYMSGSEVVRSYKGLHQPLLSDLDMSRPAAYRARDAARSLADDPTFRRDFVRLVLSITEDDGALGRLWNDIIIRAKAAVQAGMDEDVMVHALISYGCSWFVRHRGSQEGWSYGDTAELEERLRNALIAKLEGKDALQPLETFRKVMRRLHTRRFDPFPGCSKICTQAPPVCFYRRAVEDFISKSKDDLKGEWNRALTSPSRDDQLNQAWQATRRASYELIENDPAQFAATRRIRLCYVQHRLSAVFAEDGRRFLEDLLIRISTTGGTA